MSGIVGLFNLDGRPATRSELNVLGAASRHRARDGEHAWIGSLCGILHQHSWTTPDPPSEEQPLASAAGVAVAFDGRLDNRDELSRTWPELFDTEQAPSDCALALAAYERHKEHFAASLNGDFVVAVFDSERKQLVLARDLMGARRLNYCQVPGTLLFASEIKSLLADPRVTPTPDKDAVIDLVLDEWDDGHRTCFKGIYAVPPGHVLIATADQLVLRRHSAFDRSRQIRFRSFAEYVEGFRSLFEQAVRRRLRCKRPAGLMVSGGLDSSSIFCQAGMLTRCEGAALRGFAWTFPGEIPADEREFLDHLDGAFGTEITRLSYSEVRLLHNAEETIGHLETPGFAWDAQHDLLERAAQVGCSVILDGYFGDQMLFGQGYLVDLAHRGRWGRVRHDLGEFGSWMTDVDPEIFRSEFRKALLRSVLPRWLFQAAKKRLVRRRSKRYPPWYRKRLVDGLLDRQLDRFKPKDGSGSYHATEYHQHATAGHYLTQVQHQSALGLMHGIEVLYPFRDRDLVAYLMAIPGEVVNPRGIPKGLLRQALSGVLPDPIRNRRWKADFTPLANRAVVQDYDIIVRLLTSDCLSVRAGFVDGGILERAIVPFKTEIASAGDAVAGWQAVRLAGLELWLRRFFPGQFGVPCTTS